MPYKDKKSDAAVESNKKSNLKYYQKNKKAQLVRNKSKRDLIRDFVHKYKESRGCMDCGEKLPYYVLDLDHREPSEKEFTPSRLYKNGSWSVMRAELDKCDVVCANCHRIRTHEKNHYVIRKQLTGKEEHGPAYTYDS